MARLATLLFLLCSFTLPATAAEPPAQRFVVFFGEWSAALDPAAQQVVASAAAVAKVKPHPKVHVAGFADRTGGKEANILLSLLRAQRVVDQLQADHVPAAQITQAGRGAVNFVATSQEARRVEITIGGR